MHQRSRCKFSGFATKIYTVFCRDFSRGYNIYAGLDWGLRLCLPLRVEQGSGPMAAGTLCIWTALFAKNYNWSSISCKFFILLSRLSKSFGANQFFSWFCILKCWKICLPVSFTNWFMYTSFLTLMYNFQRGLCYDHPQALLVPKRSYFKLVNIMFLFMCIYKVAGR